MKKYLKSICGGVLTAAAVLSLAACASQSSESAPSSGGDAAGSSASNVEQVFYLSQPLSDGANDSIPHAAGQGSGTMLNYLLYRPLLKYNPSTDKLEPQLVDEWKVSDDELTYTFDMKDALKWSDGDDLTAEDVRFSIETVLKATLVNGIFPENFSKIEGATEFKEGKADHVSGITIDGDIVTIKLTEKVGLFAKVLGQLDIIPEHKLKDENVLEIHNSDFWKNPVSSGMYKVKEISAGNYIELERNEYYEGTKPKIDRVVSTFINDSLLAMKDGQSYYLYTNKIDDYEQLSNTPGITGFDVDILFYRYFITNLSGHKGEGNSLVDDVKVRQALMYGIDREKLASSIFRGHMTVNQAGVPSQFPEYEKSLETYKFDPEKAKKLLKEANFDFSRTFKITYYHTDQTTINFIEAVAQQLKELGITVETVQITSDPTTALTQTKDYDIALKGFSTFSYESWYGEYSSKSTSLTPLFNHDDSFDALLEQLITSSDEKERAAILSDLQKLEQEKLHKLPLFTSPAYLFVNTDKVQLPEDMTFSNPYYYYDLRFEEWSIK